MEVHSAVLEKLVCERCSGYLSRGPVYLVEIGRYRCGRCLPSEEEDGTRAEAYEQLAKLMTFPCGYQKYGCTRKVPFLDNKRHEEACPFREYLCPVTESGQCHWTGPHTGILEHCQQDHPTKLFLQDHPTKLQPNPCKFTYDITRPSLSNYVLLAFEVLFLIQSKVCTASRKIYHAVRLIDDPARASDFKFTIEMKNNNRLFSIHGDVLPRQLLTLQEDTSVVTGINSLLEVLGDFKDTTFTVTVESSGQGTSRSTAVAQVTPPPPVKTLELKVSCSRCCTFTEPEYRGDWLCKKHAPEQRTCKNSARGCTYSGVDKKCWKHELFYCQYSSLCRICSEDITSTTLDVHYTQAHGDITHRAGTVGTVSTPIGSKYLIIECDFGRALCWCRLHDSYFVLSVYTPLASAQLHKYRCTVHLGHPDTGHTLTRTPAVRYTCQVDWLVCIPRADYDTCVHDEMVNMKINITEIDDPSQILV